MTPLLSQVGYAHTHRLGLIIDRPRGWPEWVVVQFIRPGLVRLPDGQIEHTPAGRLLLFAPGQPQWYQGDQQGLGNHWFHATGLEDIVEALQIPTGIPCSCKEPAETAAWFLKMEEEYRGRRPGWSHVTSALLVEILRSCATTNHNDALSAMRWELLSDISKPWTIPHIARRLSCSVPTLHRRWRQAFGTSPLDDLIASRIERARWLITVAGASVNEAARKVGYTDPRYFARLCRRHGVGMPSSWSSDSE